MEFAETDRHECAGAYRGSLRSFPAERAERSIEFRPLANAARPASGAPSVTHAPNVPHATLARALDELHARYGAPIIVSETNRAGAGRAQWLRDFGAGIGCALERGVPVIGAGLCRVVERPAWEGPRYWRERRLWDVLLDPGDTSPRSSDSAYESALRDVRAQIDPLIDHSHHRYTS